jgi:hypothetical protein
MKAFSEQIRECMDEGKYGSAQGPYFPYDKFPELLPWNPRKAAEILKKEKGLRLSACLRFGGSCHSGKVECKKLRNFPIPEDYIDTFKRDYEDKLGH